MHWQPGYVGPDPIDYYPSITISWSALHKIKAILGLHESKVRRQPLRGVLGHFHLEAGGRMEIAEVQRLAGCVVNALCIT